MLLMLPTNLAASNQVVLDEWHVHSESPSRARVVKKSDLRGDLGLRGLTVVIVNNACGGYITYPNRFPGRTQRA